MMTITPHTIRLTPQIAAVVQQLLSRGMHGHSVEECCEHLIVEAIRMRLGKEANGAPLIVCAEHERLAAIVTKTSIFTGVKVAEILGDKRDEEIARARHIAIYAAMNTHLFTAAKVGRYFSRDHSTVIHSVKTVKDLMKFDTKLQKTVLEVTCA